MIHTVADVLDLVWPGLAAWALAAAILPWVRRENEIARTAMLGVGAALILRYVLWRAFYSLPEAGFTTDFAVGLVFFVVEAAALAGACLNALFLSRTRDRTPDVERDRTWLEAQSPLPLVDVLICTYNEEADILERTMIGAIAMDYPRFRVWVCDDGRRPWLREMCDRIGCGYISRPDNRHAKAGNINHALGVLAGLPERPAFVSILDADFVPRSMFLSRALTLFRDPRIGIVQTPQHFINADPIQSNLSAASAWPDEQRFFFDVLMSSKDAWDAAFCCGTSSVIRFEPLVAMGGFPTDSVTEDYLVTLRLKERGFGTAYLNEPLTLGLAPEGIKEYITQRGRWCLGFIQICRGRSGPFSPTSPLKLVDRLGLVDGFISWVFVYSYRLLGMIVPTLYLLFGVKAVETSLDQLLGHFLPFFFWNLAVMNWIGQGRILPIMTDVCHLIAAPTVLKSATVGLLRPKNQRFKVTAKGGDRSRRFVEWPLMRFCLLLITVTTAGLLSSWLEDGRLEDGDAVTMALVWSWYNLVVLTVACFVCIELPRLRRSERVAISGPATLELADGTAGAATLRDLSILGARLEGRTGAAPGDRGTLNFGSLRVTGEVVRVGSGEFAMRFDDDADNRAKTIRFIYGQLQMQPFRAVRASNLGAAVLHRLFR